MAHAAEVFPESMHVPQTATTGMPLVSSLGQVSAYVRGLSEDSTSNPGEQRDGRGPESEPRHYADVLENPVHDCNAQQTDSHDRYAHDRAAVEGDSQSRVQALHSLDGSAGVCSDGYAHAYETRQAGAEGAHQVCYGRRGYRAVCAHLAGDVIVNENSQYDGDNDYEDRQQGVLPGKKGHRALLYGPSDELYLFAALVLPKNVQSQ